MSMKVRGITIDVYKGKKGAGEVTWWLNIFVAFAEDLGLVPSTHITTNNSLGIPLLENMMCSSGLYRHHVHGTNMQANTRFFFF